MFYFSREYEYFVNQRLQETRKMQTGDYSNYIRRVLETLLFSGKRTLNVDNWKKNVTLQIDMDSNITKQLCEYFSTQPVLKAWVFGSYARGEQGPNSDIDILVRFDRERAKVGLLKYHTWPWEDTESRGGLSWGRCFTPMGRKNGEQRQTVNLWENYRVTQEE